MATNFPGSLDSFTNPTSSSTLDSPSHSAQHSNVNDAVEALEAKVGADGSAVTSSLDYKVSAVEDGLSVARPLLTDGAYIDGTNGLVLSGLTGNYASTPDSAALDITGDMEIVVRCALDDWTPTGTFQGLVAKFDGPSGSGRSYFFRANGSTQKLDFGWFDSGTSTVRNLQSTADVPFSDGQMGWVKVEFDADNGASQAAVKFYTAADQATEPAVWTQLGTTLTSAGVAAIDVGTFPVVIGSDNTASRASSGTFSRAIIRDGIGGTVVFDADFESEAADTLAFTEDSSFNATVSVNTTRYTVGLPGSSYQSVGTSSVTANRDHFHSFPVTQPIEVDMFVFESTTGPASNATIHAAVYAATDDYQPTGAPLITWTGTVGASATGVFYLQTSAVTLPSGQYVLALNASLTFTWRSIRRSAPLLHTMGASPFTFAQYAARTNAAFPNPSAGWNLQAGSTSSEAIYAVLRWRPL